MDWTALNAIASVISTFAFVVGAIVVVFQLRHMAKDRFVAATGSLFEIWQSREFQEAQLWILHRLEERTWNDFLVKHRGDFGEGAFHRVGGFYNRVGTLTMRHLIDKEVTLRTMGGYAIAVWRRIEPLVLEARRVEHSNLFEDFERMLPDCFECYAPALEVPPAVAIDADRDFLETEREAAQRIVAPERDIRESTPVPSVSPKQLRHMLDHGEPVTVLDVRSRQAFADAHASVPGSVRIAPHEIPRRYGEVPRDRLAVAYCTWRDEATSARVARFLQEQGYTQVAVLEGGWQAWVDGGHPVVKTEVERAG